jgi:hypothetical protein
VFLVATTQVLQQFNADVELWGMEIHLRCIHGGLRVLEFSNIPTSSYYSFIGEMLLVGCMLIF